MPEGASIDTFELRVSIASVVDDGPFSSFPGVDRYIAVIDGPGMDLDVDGAHVSLDPGVLVRFSGDASTTGRLRGGPVRDLNLMVRRPSTVTATFGDVRGITATEPTVLWVAEGALGPLRAGDAAWLEPGDRLAGSARTLLVARFEPARSQDREHLT